MGPRLSEFFDEWRDEPFSWQNHHCLIFIARACHFQTGRWPVDVTWLQCDTEMTAKRRLAAYREDFGARSIPDILDDYFKRSTCIPPDGSIVAKCSDAGQGTGMACGIVSGDRGVFVDHDGLQFVKLDPLTDLYWNITDDDD